MCKQAAFGLRPLDPYSSCGSSMPHLRSQHRYHFTASQIRTGTGLLPNKNGSFTLHLSYPSPPPSLSFSPGQNMNVITGAPLKAPCLSSMDGQLRGQRCKGQHYPQCTSGLHVLSLINQLTNIPRIEPFCLLKDQIF